MVNFEASLKDFQLCDISDWGEWPYRQMLPSEIAPLPEGVEPLTIVDTDDLRRLDPKKGLPDPEKTCTTLLLTLPVLIGHLSSGASALLICRSDEYTELLARINEYTKHPENLAWVEKTLKVLSEQTQNSLRTLSFGRTTVPSEVGAESAKLFARLLDYIQPQDALYKASGLGTMLDRLNHYMPFLSKDIKNDGFSVGLVAHRRQPMRGELHGYLNPHLTLHAYILNRHAPTRSVPLWN